MSGRKASNSGKILVSEFEAMKQQFLADIAAEVIMNEIPHGASHQLGSDRSEDYSYR